MPRGIRRVAVLGAGVMGSGIAAHLANAGIESVLFDMVPADAGSDPAARNRLAATAIAKLAKHKPAPLYRKDGASLITAANYEDHGELLGQCDWIVEVVVERLDIKQKVFQWVAEHRKPGSIVSSNTSGIRLADMAAGLSQEMRERFLVTHFFNPVRYMRLLEIVTGPDTLPEVTAQLAEFGESVLGKGIVYGKDTPNFVANRIGTFGMAAAFRAMADTNTSIEDMDAIFGTPVARPKSAIFNTADVVGIDTLGKVFANVYDNAPDDEEREAYKLPAFVEKLIAAGATGRKAGAGFFKMDKSTGKKRILVLDPETMEYREQNKTRYPCIKAARSAETPQGKIAAMVWGDDDAAKLAWRVNAETVLYAARRIPEIADDIVNIDRAMRWGFGWDLGPFEVWDAMGVEKSVERMKADGMNVPAWVDTMLASGRTSFYARNDDGRVTAYDPSGDIAPVKFSDAKVFIADLKAKNAPVDRNPSASLHDMGDGALLLEFHSKMNALDDGIIDLYSKALDKLDNDEFEALVVANESPRAFCAGANLLMILMGANQGDWDSIENMLNSIQQVLMRAKYSTKPVVTAPHALTLGGGCEVAMQSSATVGTGELYMGLVEVGVGLIPGAGGCKELVARATSDLPLDLNMDVSPLIQKAFERIGTAQVTTSGGQAQDWGYLRPTDPLILDSERRLQSAKQVALGLAKAGYRPAPERSIPAAGEGCRAAIDAFLYQMQLGGHASEHDAKIGSLLAKVLTGGDVPTGTRVSEQHYLDLEREVFLSLCGEAKTQERIQHMLMNNKPLRN